MLVFKNIDETNLELVKYKKITTVFSLIRVFSILLLITFLICLFSLKEYILYSILSLSSFILFIALVLLSNPFYKKEELLKNKNKCYMKHKQRRNKDYSHFADNGIEFLDREDYKLADLDVFGNKSIYQYLSEAKTPMGRNLLAKQLSKPDDLGCEFPKFVDYLKDKEECLDLEASLQVFKKGSNLLKTDEFISLVSNKIKFNFIYLLPLFSFILMIAYIILILTIGINPYYIFAFLLFNIISTKFLITEELMKKDVSGYYFLADLYYDLSKTIEKVELDNDYYKKLKENIVVDLKPLKQIRNIYSLLNIRRNLIINILSNILFSFDSILVLILKYRIKDGIKISNSLEAIAKLELALSFKNIGMDNEISSIPLVGEKIDGIGLYHPLVKNCIPNDIKFSGGIILTGSNMSGKTTFMRTLAICELLSNAGSIVPASRYVSIKARIYTSLRANDMLTEGVSTFYAEIKRMKLINERIKEEKCLVLVDEIFKGTNAVERIDASKRVIEKLNKYNQSFIISTHDFELCDVSNITNYHFEETYTNDEISFDYKLKEGPLKKGNAIYLLKLSGIIEE